MGWARRFFLIGFLFNISHVNPQYVIRRDFPSAIQNIPVTNLPVYGNQITPFTLPNNNVAANIQQAYNKEELKAKLVTTLEKLKLANNVLSNLNTVLNNYVTPAAKLAQAGALTGMNTPLTDLSTPQPRLRVPIVNEVPIGALRVARNLPLTNLAGPIQTVSNNVQMFGRGVNYQSVTGVPLNNIARVPVNNVPNIPLNTFLPANAVPSYGPGRANYWNTPWNNIQNTPVFNRVPVNNIRNIPIRNPLPQTNYVQRPITNFPVINANIARIPTTTGIGNVPIGNFVNFPYNYVQRPSVNLNNIGNMRINDLINLPLDKFASLASNALSRLPRANTRIGDCYSCEQMPIASSGVNKIIANVPIVPLNSLAELPAYKGLPVIKVSESVYRLTPVNSY